MALVSAFAISAHAEESVCLSEIKINSQKIEKIGEEWTVVSDERETKIHKIKEFEFYNGHPTNGNFIRPRLSVMQAIEGGDITTEWSFDENENLFVSCIYKDTKTVLTKKINAKKCFAFIPGKKSTAQNQNARLRCE